VLGRHSSLGAGLLALPALPGGTWLGGRREICNPDLAYFSYQSSKTYRQGTK